MAWRRNIEALVDDLRAVVGERWVSIDDSDLVVYSRDMWPRGLLAVQHGGRRASHAPHVVVWPGSARETAAIVRIAREQDIPVVPYGGGSGVCGGAVPLYGGISVDVKRMDQLRAVDSDELTCDVEAGANGERFERELHGRGFTLGHFPSSIYCSTVGGWLACRAAGQLSNKYGKIEDRVLGLTLVTGRGEIVTTDTLSRATRGPNWNQVIVGSEGTFGIITSARFRIAPAPELVVLRGFNFPDVTSGIEAIRRVMQKGLRPAVVRLYDELDTFMHDVPLLGEGSAQFDDEDSKTMAPQNASGLGALPQIPEAIVDRAESLGQRLLSTWRNTRRDGAKALQQEALFAALDNPRLINGVAQAVTGPLGRRGCRMIIGLEGSRIRTDVEARLVFAELERSGGTDLGEEPGREWLAHRYAISYQMSKVFRSGAFVDTMEVASTWDKLIALYHSVRAAIARHAFVMAHFSHAYNEGCSIYFTFAARGSDLKQSEAKYDRIWRDGMIATSRAGGTISHHHGIGLLKAPHMQAEHREAMTLMNALKKTFDPDQILNPGKLGLVNKRSSFSDAQ